MLFVVRLQTSFLIQNSTSPEKKTKQSGVRNGFEKGAKDIRKFIQKQNLQVSLLESVIRPPRRGPATVATAYMLETTDM